MEYTQAWLRGEANVGADFVNEGLRLSDGSGWVAIGDTNIESETSNKNEQVKATKNQSIFSFLSNGLLVELLFGQLMFLFCA